MLYEWHTLLKFVRHIYGGGLSSVCLPGRRDVAELFVGTSGPPPFFEGRGQNKKHPLVREQEEIGLETTHSIHQQTLPPGRKPQPLPPHVPHCASQQMELDCRPGNPLLQTASGTPVGSDVESAESFRGRNEL